MVRTRILICLMLVLVTFATFYRVLDSEFSIYDDNKYVTANPHVQAGLTEESINWAFTATHASNWHPLTWMSHMLDCQVYEMNPMKHHLTNLILHIANTLLLFFALGLMTKSVWKSAFVAALFGIHPLHVESVAWVAERKDVLSTFFFMLTVLSYVWYVKRPKVGRYLLVSLLFALGLMSKPMLVTLPFVLLLLDYWPLDRFQSKGKKDREVSWKGWKLIREKISLFTLAAASSAVTYVIQQKSGAVQEFERYPLGIRVANALVAYISYIRKMIWPSDLAVFYPHPERDLPQWQVIGAGLILIGVFALVIRSWRRRPYLAVGWLWYVGTLIPVVGFVQVGLQAMADRYTYLPLIGLFIIIAWGIPDLISGWKQVFQTKYLACPAISVVLALSMVAWIQVGYWQNSEALFERALACTNSNSVAHNNLGLALADQGRLDEAISHYIEALKIDPRHELAYSNLGVALARQGKTDEAIMHFKKALECDSQCFQAYFNLGFTLGSKGQIKEAIDYFSKGLKIAPDDAKARFHLGVLLIKAGRNNEAAIQFQEVLKLRPDNAGARYYLGFVLSQQGKTGDALREFREAIRLQPNSADAYNSLAWILAADPNPDFRNGTEAVRLAETACRLSDYKDPAALDTLAAAYAEAGRYEEAVKASKNAVAMAESAKQYNSVEEFRYRLRLYQSKRPFRYNTKGPGKVEE